MQFSNESNVAVLYNSALESLSWDEVYECDDPNNAWHKLKVILCTVYHKAH